MYIYVAQLGLVLTLNMGFLSEITTRWSILLGQEAKKFSTKAYELLSAKIINWLDVGFLWGALWKLAFDVKL